MKCHIYKADDGWRWHLIAQNGRIVAESGEAYEQRGKCMRAFNPKLWVDAEKVIDKPKEAGLLNLLLEQHATAQ